ncbi:hypothetical protein Tco_1255518 [Tanacetum coccineum]
MHSKQQFNIFQVPTPQCTTSLERLFTDVGTFKDVLSRNMQNLERQLTKETLHEKDSNSGLSRIKVQFDNFIHLRVLELSNSNSHDLEITQDFKAYTKKEAKSFKDLIIQHMESHEQCFVEGARHEQEILIVTPHSWPQVRKSSFAKPYDVNAPDPSRNNLKHVSFQSPREYVGSNDMVHNSYLEEAKKNAQLQKDKALNTKPSVQQSARLPNTANGNKPKPRNFNQQPRNWPPSMSSRVSNRTVNTNQKSFLKSKDLASPTCKKCIYSANYDECILKYLSKVNSRASA